MLCVALCASSVVLGCRRQVMERLKGLSYWDCLTTAQLERSGAFRLGGQALRPSGEMVTVFCWLRIIVELMPGATRPPTLSESQKQPACVQGHPGTAAVNAAASSAATAAKPRWALQPANSLTDQPLGLKSILTSLIPSCQCERLPRRHGRYGSKYSHPHQARAGSNAGQTPRASDSVSVDDQCMR